MLSISFKKPKKYVFSSTYSLENIYIYCRFADHYGTDAEINGTDAEINWTNADINGTDAMINGRNKTWEP